MEKTQIAEESGIQNDWYAEAKKMKMEELPAFLRKLTEDYCHDYGTICHAVAAGAIAAAYAVNNSDAGGITGFQASCIMWEFVRHWSKENNNCGLRLIDYDDMLYPQYDERFDKTITPSTWSAIQTEAKKCLAEDSGRAHSNVVAHWKSIADGVVPFGYSVKED